MSYYEVLRPSRGWATIRERYSPGRRNEPLERLLKIVTLHGVKSVVIEPYIDPHFRSEYSRFYATTFRPHTGMTDRLHFFTAKVPSDYTDLSQFQSDYRGYSILRPIPSNPVGRTMLTPPPELGPGLAAICAGEEEVHPFGWPLRVSGMPFISSDGQYLRCAHAVQWMVLYHAYLAHGLPRRLPADIHDASMGGAVVGRQIPSEGLSHAQILNSLQRLELPAGRTFLPQTRNKSRNGAVISLFSSLCRYVNSQLPPIVLSPAHARVVVGYRREEGDGPVHDRTVLYVHDDALGPYLPVKDPWEDPFYRWGWAIPPLPARLYLNAEHAEAIGQFWIQRIARTESRAPILDAIQGGRLRFRTYAIRSASFKMGIEGRVSDDIAAEYKRLLLPGYVWVVEGVDVALLEQRRPCVLGEVIIDTTAENLENPGDPEMPAVLAVHVAGTAFSLRHDDVPEEDSAYMVHWPDFEPYRSGCVNGDW